MDRLSAKYFIIPASQVVECLISTIDQQVIVITMQNFEQNLNDWLKTKLMNI